MKSSAVIVAAGLSSRMGRFKPLLPLGEETFLSRIVHTFRNSGVDEIIVVTGHQKDLVAQAMAALPVRLVENPAYATTDMFASVRIGLEAVADQSQGCLLTCVDAPLFTSNTVTSLLQALREGAPLAVPCYKGQEGHPVALSREMIGPLLRYSGGEGLRGALAAAGPAQLVATPDVGVTLQANTPEEYQALLDFLLQPKCGCRSSVVHQGVDR